jgi:type VI secretion system secreted protein VgrG
VIQGGFFRLRRQTGRALMPGDVMARVMEIVTPLGEDVLLFHGMSAREEMSRPFEYQLDLLSKKKDVGVDDILGKNVTIKLGLPDDQTRYFNGYVTRFAQGAMIGPYYRYLATVRPWFWFLTRTADCRIFQEMKVPDIIKSVFADHRAADYKFELTGTYKKWTYCVQYRETDFNFISRLMEQEGIAYYFRHTDGHDTMVLTDSTRKHTPVTGYEKSSFISPEQQVKPDSEHIHSWDFQCEIQPGVYVHDDYDLERPSVELKASKPLPRTYSPSDYEVYDYPGMYVQKPDGEQYALVRIDEMGTQFHIARAATNARGIAVGALWSLEHHKREDQNREYLIVGANYDLSFENYESLPEAGGTGYQCSFVAMPSSQQFRPKRMTPKPFVQGPQTAVVVGPGGEEIYTDKYGRVKVQFHWDRRGKKDENSSCWIRVSHPWAGKGWGAVSTPRIGQEVIVDFLEGDPDQPIITGRVYNAEQLPPFGFPAGAVVSGIKSDTHKGSGYNELSMDDTAGKEKITIHGQYDMNSTIEHDQTLTVHNCRTDRVDVDDSESIGNNQKWDVGVNRDASIGSNETLTVGANRTKKIGANETITVGSNRNATIGASESLTVALQRTHSVGINETISVGAAQEITVGAAQTVTVGANQTNNIGANQSTSVGANQSTSVGADQSTNVGANQSTNVASNQSTSAGADIAISAGGKFGASAGSDFSGSAGGNMGLKAGGDFAAEAGGKGSVSAGSELTLVCGGASIVLKSGGEIEIKGTDITIDGSGKISVKAGGDMVLKGSKIDQN